MRKIFCAAAVVFALLPALAFAQPRSKVPIGYASMSSVATTLWAAQEKGFFARNGIEAAAIFIPGSPTLIATLNTGDVQFGYTGGTATLGAAVGGLDLKIVAAFANHVQSDFVTRPEIRTECPVRFCHAAGDSDRRRLEGQARRRHEHRRHRLDVGDARPGAARPKRRAR